MFTHAVVLLCLAAPSVQDRLTANDLPRIESVRVTGNKLIMRDAIVRMSGLKVGEIVSPTDVLEAAERLRASGYFGFSQPDPRRGVEVTPTIHGRSEAIAITVVENPTIERIVVLGSGPIRASEILAAMALKRGGVFSQPRLKDDVAAIQRLYDIRGYQAFVSEGVSFKDGVVTVPIVIGRIKSITMTGLDRINEPDLRKRMKVKAGDYYNVNAMKRQMTDLYNTGEFDEVEPKFTFPSPGSLDLVINLKEKPRR